MSLNKKMKNSKILILFNKFFCNTIIKNRLNKGDKNQLQLLKDKLIIVDKYDNKIGYMSKLDAHLIKNNNKYPHRAFSLFIFDNNNNFILHQRASTKFTFPLLWTNACCSHPLANSKEEEKNIGIKRSVIRRCKYELNIDINIEDLLLVDKVLYRAVSDDIFEEFERNINYIYKYIKSIMYLFIDIKKI